MIVVINTSARLIRRSTSTSTARPWTGTAERTAATAVHVP